MSEHDLLKQVAGTIHLHFKERGSPLSLSHSAQLATVLSLVATELEDGNPFLLTPTDQISEDLEVVIDYAKKLCQVICFPYFPLQTSSPISGVLTQCTEQVSGKLAMCDPRTRRPEDTARVKGNIRAFIERSEKSETREAQIIKRILVPKCQSPLAHAFPNQALVSTHTTRDPPDTALVDLNDKIKRRLLQGLQLQELCSECAQMEAADGRKEQRHHVRLLLKNSGHVDNREGRLIFDTMVSPLHMTHWQETCLDLRYAILLQLISPVFLIIDSNISQTKETSRVLGRNWQTQGPGSLINGRPRGRLQGSAS